MQEIYYPSKDGKTTIHAVIWRAEQPKGIVQIVHGMSEYALRYQTFAKHLTDNGYIVCAEDHLGHGKSVTDDANLGYFTEGDGRETILSDIRELKNIVCEKYPDLPYFILGHSMGSYFTRLYISKYHDVNGAVIVGTGYESGIATSFGKTLTRLIATFKGWHYKSKLLNSLSFGVYNKKIQDRRTEYDWLSRNSENVDNYISDEQCGVMFTCSGFMGLFSVVSQACKNKTIKATPKNLPIFIASGKDDPVGGYSKGVIKLYDKYIANGIENVSMTIYDDARHEILNDYCAPQVYADVVDFLNTLTFEEVVATVTHSATQTETQTATTNLDESVVYAPSEDEANIAVDTPDYNGGISGGIEE
jgi:alpha-beta hydrolase superfamily lysophospholipase